MPRKEAPDLTFAWPNLTVACEACNGAKGDYWDPQKPLLNPYEDDPARFLWSPDEWMRPWADSPRGDVTIQQLELNRDDLVEWRRQRLRQLQGLIDRWLDAETEGERAGFRRAIEQEMAPDKEYLLMVRGLVAGHVTGFSTPAAPTP